MRSAPRVVYVFVDASNLWAAQKVKRKFFDLEKLKKYLLIRFQATEISVFYYDAYPADSTREYSSDNKHRFYTYLKKALNFTVRKKPLKQIKVTTARGIVVEEKGNMDVEMTIDAVNLIPKYDTAVLFSGDSDFLALVRYIRSKGKKVHIFSSKNNVSNELRTGADGYTDVLNIPDDIWRGEVKHRESRHNTNDPRL